METKTKNRTALQRLGDITIIILIIMSIALVIAEFVFGRKEKIGIESLPLFPALFGFIVFILIIYGGIYLRTLLMRREDYYDK